MATARPRHAPTRLGWVTVSILTASTTGCAGSAASKRSVGSPAPLSSGPAVHLEARPPDHRVDVLVDGQPFTSYRYEETLKKPVLYPLRSDRGQLVTRGFPLDPRPGESEDHPHHIGLWLNYGDVNGVDFWNNSATLSAEEQAKMGLIRHRRVVSARDGRGHGELEIEAEWLLPGGKPALVEKTRFVFHASAGERAIDRLTTLEAVGARVSMPDNKEGFLGLRVARGLEHPSHETRTFVDAEGRATKVGPAGASEAQGHYLTSEGAEGEKAWGTRARWTLLTGSADAAPVSVAILDHPDNPGFPTYWHARGYGLFAANPLGASAFSEAKEFMRFAIDPDRPARFGYRVVILSKQATREDIESRYRDFARER
jgi:Methane oxygenase PmoA